MKRFWSPCQLEMRESEQGGWYEANEVDRDIVRLTKERDSYKRALDAMKDVVQLVRVGYGSHIHQDDLKSLDVVIALANALLKI